MEGIHIQPTHQHSSHQKACDLQAKNSAVGAEDMIWIQRFK
jgi:hypothetical protein